MSVLIDSYNGLGPKGRRYCHMMGHTDVELEAMARALGLQPSWRHGDHYDVTAAKKVEALKLGAIEVDAVKLVELRISRRPTQRTAA